VEAAEPPKAIDAGRCWGDDVRLSGPERNSLVRFTVTMAATNALGTDLTASRCPPGENGAWARLMIASLGLPHWLMIAGTLLVVAGFVGALVSGKKAKEVEPPSDEPTDASRQQMPPLPSLLDSRPKTDA
jgi:hypothetical protein